MMDVIQMLISKKNKEKKEKYSNYLSSMKVFESQDHLYLFGSQHL